VWGYGSSYHLVKISLINLKITFIKEVGSPIQEIIDGGLVPFLISNVKRTENTYFQRECAWALTNIAAGTTQQTEMILEQGALAPIMSLLDSNEEDIAEQAIWAIGNIAGDNSGFRDQILNFGIQGLVRIGMNTKNPNLFKNVTWALSNLCRGKPPASYELTKESAKVFAEGVKRNNENVVVGDALWALSCLSGMRN